MENVNKIKIILDSRPENEAFIRVAIAAFCISLNPTLEELADIKTAVSEAVTNCIIHAYEQQEGEITVFCILKENELSIEIQDTGKGIDDIEKAMEPLFTTKPDEDRSGMGFTFMEAFMDELRVKSAVGMGTTVFMKKKIRRQ